MDDDGNIISTGFNGFPRGVKDYESRYADRETKLLFISHAEANAIAQAARVGAKVLGASLIVTALHPCSTCAKLIVQAGIKKVYAPKMDMREANDHWFNEMRIAEALFSEAGIEVEIYG